MKLLTLFLISALTISCNTNRKDSYIEIYKYESNYDDDDVIRGSELIQFFRDNKFIHKKVFFSDTLVFEINKLKSYIGNKNKIKNNMSFGIYKYAIKNMKGTLYCSSDFKSWKYKDRVGIYKNDYIESIIKELFDKGLN